MKPRIVLQQKITAFVNKYKIFAADENGNAGQLVGFAQQKRFNFKEKILFYADENKSQVVFTLRAEKVFDIHGRYIIEDANGAAIGMFKKEFRKSLINSSWKLQDAAENDIITVRESNKILAAMRRVVGLIPFVGDIFELIIVFFRYHFTFTDVASGQEVGRYTKTTLFRDHYMLELTDEAYAKIDWRVYAAYSVALDALQSR